MGSFWCQSIARRLKSRCWKFESVLTILAGAIGKILRGCGKTWSFFKKIGWSSYFWPCSVSVRPLETRFVPVDREMNSLRYCSLGSTKTPIPVAQEPLQHEKSNFAIGEILMYIDIFSTQSSFPHECFPINRKPIQISIDSCINIWEKTCAKVLPGVRRRPAGAQKTSFSIKKWQCHSNESFSCLFECWYQCVTGYLVRLRIEAQNIDSLGCTYGVKDDSDDGSCTIQLCFATMIEYLVYLESTISEWQG